MWSSNTSQQKHCQDHHVTAKNKTPPPEVHHASWPTYSQKYLTSNSCNAVANIDFPGGNVPLSIFTATGETHILVILFECRAITIQSRRLYSVFACSWKLAYRLIWSPILHAIKLPSRTRVCWQWLVVYPARGSCSCWSQCLSNELETIWRIRWHYILRHHPLHCMIRAL